MLSVKYSGELMKSEEISVKEKLEESWESLMKRREEVFWSQTHEKLFAEILFAREESVVCRARRRRENQRNIRSLYYSTFT